MKILAIETSCAAGNICLADGDQILSEQYLGDGMVHGRELIPAIRDLMTTQNWAPVELDLIAVSIGPGSFTGLRVGLAAAKTLAMICETKLVGVPTLHVMARNAPADAKYICPMTDARRKEVNACLFERKGEQIEPVWEYATFPPTELIDKLPQGTCLLGDGLKAYGEQFDSRNDFIRLPEESWHPRASYVARLGLDGADTASDDVHSLVPIYLRLPPVMEKMIAAGVITK